MVCFIICEVHPKWFCAFDIVNFGVSVTISVLFQTEPQEDMAGASKPMAGEATPPSRGNSELMSVLYAVAKKVNKIQQYLNNNNKKLMVICRYDIICQNAAHSKIF